AVMFVLAFGFLATPLLMPSVGNAQDARVAKAMAALKDQTAKLGAPRIDGRDEVGGRHAPALYFGATKMDNNFSVVDAVAEEGGRGMAATLFVKSGDDYIRVATNVSMRTGSGRGLGTILTRPPLESTKASKAYYGKVSVLGTHYVSGYEPIKDASGATIGVYFVGYTKADYTGTFRSALGAWPVVDWRSLHGQEELKYRGAVIYAPPRGSWTPWMQSLAEEMLYPSRRDQPKEKQKQPIFAVR